MTIRYATADDFPRIRDLDLGPEISTERDTVYAVFFRLFPELCLIDEEADCGLIGFALGALSSDRRESYLHDLWVTREQRGRGEGPRAPVPVRRREQAVGGCSHLPGLPTGRKLLPPPGLPACHG